MLRQHTDRLCSLVKIIQPVDITKPETPLFKTAAGDDGYPYE